MAKQQDGYRRYLAAMNYERFVADTYQSLVDRQLGLVFSHRAYKGKRSGYTHDIDVSIELGVAGLNVLILIECKHYKKSGRRFRGFGIC